MKRLRTRIRRGLPILTRATGMCAPTGSSDDRITVMLQEANHCVFAERPVDFRLGHPAFDEIR